MRHAKMAIRTPTPACRRRTWRRCEKSSISAAGKAGRPDTDIIEIPVDTPEACVDAAITEASNRRNGEHPLFVGLYNDNPDEGRDEEEDDQEDPNNRFIPMGPPIPADSHRIRPPVEPPTVPPSCRLSRPGDTRRCPACHRYDCICVPLDEQLERDVLVNLNVGDKVKLKDARYKMGEVPLPDYQD